MKPNIITIDKKKFLKLLAASNVGYVSSLYDRTAVKRALDQATVTALNEDEYYRSKFAKQFEKFTQSKSKEECNCHCHSEKHLPKGIRCKCIKNCEHCKPTPEPEECEHEQIAIVSKGVGKTLECKFCGKRFTMTAPTWEESVDTDTSWNCPDCGRYFEQEHKCKPKSPKLPTKLTYSGEDIAGGLTKIGSKVNDILDYLKEKE